MCFCNFNSKSVDFYYYKLNLIWAFFKMVKIKKEEKISLCLVLNYLPNCFNHFNQNLEEVVVKL